MLQFNAIPYHLLRIFVKNDPFVKNLFKNIVFKNDISQEVNVYIGKGLSFFYDSLKDCLLDEKAFVDKDKDKALYWQVRQVYRIVNALLAFEREDVPFKSDLLALKKELQENEYLKPLLDDIKNEKIYPDIICSGEGIWEVGDGYVNWHSVNTKVIFYVGHGMTLIDSAAWDIENFKFDPNQMVTKCSRSKKILPLQSFITQYSYSWRLENFTLSSRSDLNLRLVEAYTGEILMTPTSITLNDIIRLYPNRTLHWAACTSMFNRRGNPIGNFAGLELTKKKLENSSIPLISTMVRAPTLFQSVNKRSGWIHKDRPAPSSHIIWQNNI